MRKFGLVLLCLFPWLVAALACLQFDFGASKPNSLETRIAFFNTHRAVFESYIERLERGEVRSDSCCFAVPQLLIDNDVKHVVRRDECVEITFWFMCTDAVPLFIYSPRGLEGVPEEYRTGGHSGGIKWSYWKFVTIDDKWFYCEWDT